MHVDEETWAEFKQVIGDRSVAEALGRYVETEVARAHRDRVKGGDLTERELVDALARARDLTESLKRITWQLQARLPLRATSDQLPFGDDE